jgi:hypothetical protein
MPSSDGKLIDEEVRYLIGKLVDSTGQNWSGSVILRLTASPRQSPLTNERTL